jgi:hypothetical protein
MSSSFISVHAVSVHWVLYVVCDGAACFMLPFCYTRIRNLRGCICCIFYFPKEFIRSPWNVKYLFSMSMSIVFTCGWCVIISIRLSVDKSCLCRTFIIIAFAFLFLCTVSVSDSSVSIVTELWAARLENCCSIPGREETLFFAIAFRLEHNQPTIQWIPDPFPRG